MVSLCVPSWQPRARGGLAELWASLPAALGGEDGELVVARNGVDAGVVPAGARSVDLGRNRGVAPGWNAAARAAAGDVLAFTNDDVVLGPGSLAAVARALAALPEAGVVGVDPTGPPVAGPPRDAGGVRLLPCAAVRGPLLALRREVFDAVGGFDEAYAPCLWEEVDLCLAVRASGLGCFVAAGVALEHRPGISARRGWPWARVRFDGRSESLRSIRRRNRRRLEAKWGGRY